MVGSQQGSPSSDQAKLRDEKESVEMARVAASYYKASSPPGSFSVLQAPGGNESAGKVTMAVGDGEVKEGSKGQAVFSDKAIYAEYADD